MLPAAETMPMAWLSDCSPSVKGGPQQPGTGGSNIAKLPQCYSEWLPGDKEAGEGPSCVCGIKEVEARSAPKAKEHSHVNRMRWKHLLPLLTLLCLSFLFCKMGIILTHGVIVTIKSSTHEVLRAARENQQDAPVIARWGSSFPACPGEQSWVLSPNSTGGLTPFRPLSGCC